MKKNYLYLLIYLLLTLMAACNNSGTLKAEEEKDQPIMEEKKDPIMEVIDSLTIEDKVSQLFIVGIEDEIIENINPGGYVFFKRNMESMYKFNNLIDEINSKHENHINPFLAIDEEGKLVSRFPSEYERFPNARDIGNSGDFKLAYKVGREMAIKLREVGLNTNFAPVLDIDSNPNNPVIGARSYGNSKELVWEFGFQTILGLRSENVIPVVKHFPGHGDTYIDSHLELPLVEKNLEEILENEIYPFKRAIGEDIEMIMIAHILYPNIDDKPATMSNKIINDILRGLLKYNNVIISDDMTMGAIVKNYSIEEAALEFLKAGGDLILICHGDENIKNTYEYILDSVKNGYLKEEEVDEKLYRILSLKKKYLI